MKFKKSLSLLLLASILITTLFAYPVFANITITLSETTISVPEGGTFQLSVTTNATKGIDWYCGGGYADVNGSGLVTGLKAGTDTIIVTAFDGTIEYTAECTVYVYKPDGVYYIKNLNSNYYLHVKDGGISDGTNVYLYNKHTTEEGDDLGAYDARQLWQTRYLGNGNYSIRPLHKLNMGLCVDTLNDNNVEITNIGYHDPENIVPTTAQWSISLNGSGYTIINNNSRNRTMQAENSSTALNANVVANTYSNTNNCRWTFELVSDPPEGVYLYDTLVKTVTTNPTIYVAPNESRSLNNMNLRAIYFPDNSSNQSFEWSSSDPTAVTVNSSTGEIKGIKPGGMANITGKSVVTSNGIVRFTVKVTLIANGSYYLKNVENGGFADANGSKVIQDSFINGYTDSNYLWYFKRYSDQYYTIKLEYDSTEYYLSTESNIFNPNDKIVLKNAEIYQGKMWKIESGDMGYKLTTFASRLENYVLATAVSTATDGTQLIQGEYIGGNNSYRDEWCIIDPFSLALYGITSAVSTHDHTTSTNKIENNGGWSSIQYRIAVVSADDCKEDLEESNVFISRGHGNYKTSPATGNLAGTFIDINDYMGQNVAWLASHYWSGRPSYCEYLENNEDYSNVELAVFIGCFTGYTGTNGTETNNLPNRIVELGATTAIGFTDEIICPNANVWTDAFWEAYLAGKTVRDAVSYACNRLNSIDDDYVIIYGNEDLRISD